jgi:autotransporter-associated beta strand protein
VDGTLLILADVTPTGNSVIGTNGTLNISDGGTPEATTISVLLDGPLTFSRVASVNRNSTTTGTQYTAVLGMTATASGAATWSGNLISATDPIVKKLRLTAPASGSVLFSGTIAANPDAVGSVAIEKVGAGTVELTGINTYDGDTTVSEGVLAVNGSALPDANKLVIDGGKVAASGVEIVGSLFFGIVEQATGTWGASGSGAAHIDNDRFSGTLGVVQVGAVVLDPYTTWIDSPAYNTPPLSAADKLPTADPDLDGISNLLEFTLGGNPVVSSQSILPTQATVGPNVVLSYKRSDESESPATTQFGQWSTDLSAWTDVVPVLVSENGALADDMTVSVPTANAVAGHLFVRLKVVKP